MSASVGEGVCVGVESGVMDGVESGVKAGVEAGVESGVGGGGAVQVKSIVYVSVIKSAAISTKT